MYKSISTGLCLLAASISTSYALQSPTTFIKNGAYHVSHCYAEDHILNGGVISPGIDTEGAYDFCTPHAAKIIESAIKKNPKPNFANQYNLLKITLFNPRGTEKDKAYYYAAVNPKTKYVAVLPFEVVWLGSGEPPVHFKSNTNSFCVKTPLPDISEYPDGKGPALMLSNMDTADVLFSKNGEPACAYLKENKNGLPYWDAKPTQWR